VWQPRTTSRMFLDTECKVGGLTHIIFWLNQLYNILSHPTVALWKVGDITRASGGDFDHRYIFRGILSSFPFLPPPVCPLLLSLPFLISPKHPESYKLSTALEYTTLGLFQVFSPFIHPRSSISSSYISNI